MWFEFILPLTMATSMAVSEVEVLMSVWDAWADPALAGKVVHPAPSVWTLGDNAGASG